MKNFRHDLVSTTRHAAALLLVALVQPALAQEAKPDAPPPTDPPADSTSAPPSEATAPCADQAPKAESKSRLSDEVIGIQPLPERPHLLVETNDHFLSPGFLSPGCELPTGAVWRPSLWVFGTNRVAAQYYEDHQTTNAMEVVDRLDLFAQLNLTGTERILFGVRPLDHEVDNFRRYSSYNFAAGKGEDGVNFYPQTLFFEGDFGELFPNHDLHDTKALDYGFSVGRQPLFLQEGMFIDSDIIDAVTVTRNTLNGHGILNQRITFMYAWDRIHRNNNDQEYLVDTKAQMFGLFTETDLKVSTIDVDLAYVTTPNDTTEDAFYFAASAAQRLHFPCETVNSTFRVMGSFPTEHQTLATGKGVLMFGEFSITPHGTEDVFYWTTFGAAGNCTSPTRGVEAGGPLSPAAGILFAKPQIGVYGAPMNTQANDVVGGAIGYQLIRDGIRKQLTFEIGALQTTDGSHGAAIGFATQYQQAMGQHCVLKFLGDLVQQESLAPITGLRVELLTKF